MLKCLSICLKENKFCKEEINNNGGLDLEYKRLICKYRYELEICKHQKEFPLIEGATNSQTFFTQKIQPLYYPKINFKNSEVDMDQRTFKSLNDEEDIEGSGEIPSQTLKTNDFPTSLQPWDI
uniref:Uncharacterized protein n=1 Tax=Strongyloides venezuelensis TaxID=75913 RepID=A0A0K0FMW9_STRVS